MKLYYAPGTCALAPHIVANEANLPVELVKVDLVTKKTEDGRDYLKISPNGYVPALELDDGRTLTEASLIVQYLADQRPESGMIPAAGTFARYEEQQRLAFVATELHKMFGAFFRPGTPEETKTANRNHLLNRIEGIEGRMGKWNDKSFTVADSYLWTVLSWAKYAGIDMSKFSNIQRFLGDVAGRPSVQKSLQEQGLA